MTLMFFKSHSSKKGLLTPGDWVNTWGDQVFGNLWGWVDGKSKLGFLPIVDGESLEKEGCKA